jgi:hypothetical protein
MLDSGSGSSGDNSGVAAGMAAGQGRISNDVGHLVKSIQARQSVG